MTSLIFKKRTIQQWITYLTLFCLIFASQRPLKLLAQEPCPCVHLVDEEDCRRTKIATVVAIASAIALVGAVAWIASGPGGHHSHSSSSSSYSYSSYPSYDYSSYSSYGGHDHDFHDHHHHHHSSSSSSSSIEPHHLPNRFSDPQLYERGDKISLSMRSRLARSKKSQESNQLSGVFTTHSLLVSRQGSMTAFVRLPDGTTQILGTLPLNSSGGDSISYGPFAQKGTYTFGVSVEDGAALSSQARVGSVEVNVDGSTVESHDFFVPAHAPANYEPNPVEYTLS